MKKILILIFVLFQTILFAQGGEKLSIDWIELDKAEKYAEKYNKNILILFYRPGCEYCERMKKETLTDPSIIKLINENFLPVMLNGKTKEPIVYNGKKYINDATIEEDPKSTWRHNLFAELVDPIKGNYYWPDVVIIDPQYKKLFQFPGFQPKAQFIRNLKRLVK